MRSYFWLAISALQIDTVFVKEGIAGPIATHIEEFGVAKFALKRSEVVLYVVVGGVLAAGPIYRPTIIYRVLGRIRTQ